MQEHRKSEETGFWAGLARSLCELSEQADFAQRGRGQQCLSRAVRQSRPPRVSGQWVAIQNAVSLMQGR